VDISDEILKHEKKNDNENEDEDREKDELDEIEKEIENDPELKRWEEKRKEELKAIFKKKEENKSQGFGHYEQMDEKDMLKLASQIKYVVIHFHSNEFPNCDIMDQHLKLLAPKHLDVRFIKCDVHKSPFLTKRWKIRTLPTLCVVVHTVLIDKIIGFTDLGNRVDFPTIALEKRLAEAGVLKANDGKRREKASRTLVLTET